MTTRLPLSMWRSEPTRSLVLKPTWSSSLATLPASRWTCRSTMALSARQRDHERRAVMAAVTITSTASEPARRRERGRTSPSRAPQACGDERRAKAREHEQREERTSRSRTRAPVRVWPDAATAMTAAVTLPCVFTSSRFGMNADEHRRDDERDGDAAGERRAAASSPPSPRGAAPRAAAGTRRTSTSALGRRRSARSRGPLRGHRERPAPLHASSLRSLDLARELVVDERASCRRCRARRCLARARCARRPRRAR